MIRLWRQPLHIINMSIAVMQYTARYITLQIAPQQHSTDYPPIYATQFIPSTTKANNWPETSHFYLFRSFY
jgi:hypothetical protein